MEEIRAKPEPKSTWTDTEDSFRSLLAWLDNGKDSDGRSYLEMRRRLVSFFDQKKCPSPDQLADETLSRVSRRLQEEGSITGETPARYCYITAKFVFLESLRKAKEADLSLDDVARRNGREPAGIYQPSDDELKERMLECLENCASQLEPPSRDLIFAYYVGKAREKIENRRAIAARLGVTPNALAIKACRIRSKLETCVGRCAGLT
jgi:DNA-directed RNA polymerase specialized sigma24 family protein